MYKDAIDYFKERVGKEIHDSPGPLMNWFTPKLVYAEEGKLIFEYMIREEMTNPFKTLHGGIIAAIIDDTIGATLISFGEPFYYITINNVVDYFATAKQNEIIIAEASIIKKGTTIVNAQCNIWNDDKSKLLARGYTNLLRKNIKGY